MASFTIEAAAAGAASPERLWEVLADVDGWPRWNPHLRWALLESTLQPGCYITLQAKKGRQTAFTILEASAPQVLRFAIRFGPLGRIVHEYRVVAEGTGSRVEGRVEIGGLLQKLLVRAAGPKLAGNLQAGLDGLAATPPGE